MKDDDFYLICNYLKKSMIEEKQIHIKKQIENYLKIISKKYFLLLCNKRKICKIIIKKNKENFNINNWENNIKMISDNQIKLKQYEIDFEFLENIIF